MSINTLHKGDDDDDDDDNNNNDNNNNKVVRTEREVTANRPDIIIKNKKEKTRTLVDVALPADRNVVQKEAENKLKYKSLCTEIQRMWNFKCTIISVITGAAGIVTRSVRKNLDRYTRETFDRFTTKESYTRNITHNMESTAVRWDHLWFVRSNRKKRSVTRDDNYSNSNSRNNNNNNNKAEVCMCELKLFIYSHDLLI